MRVFFDTNVLVSALTTRGLCNELFEIVLNTHEILTCDPVLEELKRILTDKFKLPKTLTREYINLVKSQGQVISTYAELKISLDDQDDVAVLSCAVEAQADVIVTGDRELLQLRHINDIPILSPRQFWESLAGLES